MAGVSLKCGDCGTLLRTVKEAETHAELYKHTNFEESSEPVKSLVCSECGKTCRSQTERELHTKRSGHSEFVDKTSEETVPITLEASSAQGDVNMEEAVDENSEMVVPEVDKNMLQELEAMGFSAAKATRALHFTGNANLENAANWGFDHSNDPDIEEMPLVPVNSKKEKPKLTAEEIKVKQQELRERARKKKEEEEKQMEREREKERIRRGKEMLEAKRIEEDNERKRIIALRKAEKEEERRAREKIRQKLEEDKAERRRKLGLPAEDPTTAAKPPAPVVEEKKISLPVRPATKAEKMRQCLRSLKQNHMDAESKVAFTTLLTFAKNVAINPDEEKYRKIRTTNAKFQEKVGRLKESMEFLELCGFEKEEGGEFLYLPREKVDMPVLHSAGSELNNAINNPFFGVL